MLDGRLELHGVLHFPLDRRDHLGRQRVAASARLHEAEDAQRAEDLRVLREARVRECDVLARFLQQTCGKEET